jgi:hypothetical protein
MEYFNINAFYLGVLLFVCLFISNIIYSLDMFNLENKNCRVWLIC